MQVVGMIMSMKSIEDTLRHEIKHGGQSRYKISQKTGIAESTLSRFLHGAPMKSGTIDKLLDLFGYEVIKTRKPNPSTAKHPVSNSIREVQKCLRQTWDMYAKDPYFWHSRAKCLYEAAKAYRREHWPKVRQHHDTEAAVSDFYRGPVYMLLAGLAIEGILKALIVAKRPEVVLPQKLSPELTGHDLERLYRDAGLRESGTTIRLLHRLTNYVEVLGRYPVTKTKQSMGKMHSTYFSGGGNTDFNNVDRLWERLEKKIRPYIETDE